MIIALLDNQFLIMPTGLFVFLVRNITITEYKLTDTYKLTEQVESKTG